MDASGPITLALPSPRGVDIVAGVAGDRVGGVPGPGVRRASGLYARESCVARSFGPSWFVGGPPPCAHVPVNVLCKHLQENKLHLQHNQLHLGASTCV